MEQNVSNTLLRGVEGLFIPVSDPQASAQWYASNLGCEPLFDEEEAAVVRLGNGSRTVLCLVKTQMPLPVEFPQNCFGVGKFVNFEVDDLDRVHALLVDRGVEVGAIGAEGSSRFFTFRDPDGTPLGVCASG